MADPKPIARSRCPMFAHRPTVDSVVADTAGSVVSDADAPATKRQRLDSSAATPLAPQQPPPPVRPPSPQPPPPPPPPSNDAVAVDINLHQDLGHAERMQMHEQLREFDVLDEVQGDDEDDADGAGKMSGDRPVGGDDDDDDSSDTDLETDSGLTVARRRAAAKRGVDGVKTDENHCNDDTNGTKDGDEAPLLDDLNEDELEALLNEGLPEDIRNKKFESQYDEKFKTVLVELEQNHFEVLPEGWVQVTHNSGMPLYLHTASRVCSTSRPYFLGPGSVRKHEIPISAVPCLSYRRSLDKEQLRQQQLEAVRAAHPNANANDPNIALHPIATQAVIETVHENRRNESLTSDQLTEYCRTLFRFKQVRVMRFKSWQARRKFTKSKKHIKNLQRPTLPEGTKLISFPIHHTPLPPPPPPIVVAEGNAAGSASASSSAGAAGDDASRSGGAATSTTSTAIAPILPVSSHPRQRREWIMNPNGKSYVCILHEYVQHALKKQPTYEFKELENAATPYSATVSINDLKYGTGFGTSKKQAKSEAARETLEVLIPEMRDKITGMSTGNEKTGSNGGGDATSTTSGGATSTATTTTTSASNNGSGGNSHSTATGSGSASTPYNKDASVFDHIPIEDPRVTELCSKTTEPLPHAILLTCLQRNYGLGEVKIAYQVNTTKHKRNEFTMTVGKHSVTVACKNKRDGKHLAAQAILQTLHPHVRTWGSLLRLYGNRSVKSFKEKKQEEQEITVLQSRAAINQPNYAILDKLRLEMTKLMERRAAVRPIGTFRPPVEIDLPAASGSGLNNVEL